jgi:thiol:disulfide interchange protein DsbG
MKKFLSIALLLCAFSSPAFATDKAAPAPELPEALEELVSRGAQIRYLGKEHGLDGWIAIYQGQEQYYYVTADKKAFLTGLLFGADGNPITINQVRNLQAQGGALLDLLAEGPAVAEKPQEAAPIQSLAETMKSQTPSERLFREVENSNWIAIGKDGAPVVYSFVDPQCPHCHAMLADLRKDYIDTGLIQIRIMPVGFQPGSLAQAAFLLAAPNGAELFLRHLDGDEQALPAKGDISTQAVQKNMALMQAWKFNVTPLSIYRGQDSTIKIIRGKPKDAKTLLSDLPQGSSIQ